MKEYHLKKSSNTNLPATIGTWGKVKNFLYQEIEFMNRPIILELTPKEEKVLRGIRDFFCEDNKISKIQNFFSQEINIFGRKDK